MSTTASLRAVIDATRRLDELSTARVVEQAAEATHKAQKGGQPLGTLSPDAILVTVTGISLEPPASAPGGYTAPEVLEGKTADRRSDVYALGVILWEALAHTRLFDGKTESERRAEILTHEFIAPSENNANIPAELDAICKKALSRDPAERYPSAKVLAAEIATVLDDAGYPDDFSQVTAYLRDAFPPLSAGASLAAKLASTPVTAPQQSPRIPLNQTMMGIAPVIAPLREPEPPRPEPVIELTKEKVVELTEVKPPAELRAKTASSQPLSPMAFAKPATLPPPILAAIPKPPTIPPPIVANPMTTLPFGSMAVSAAEIATAEKELAAKPTIASAETVATPAVITTKLAAEPETTTLESDALRTNKVPAAKIVDAVPVRDSLPTNKLEALAPASGVLGLPSSPPGSADGPPLMPAPAASVSTVDPAAAVSLPMRSRRESQGDGMLERWASTTGSHAVVDDGYETDIEEAQRKQKKRLLVAIGGALGAILLVIIIAMAVGGDKKPTKPAPEATNASGMSRTAAEPSTKAVDSPPPPPPEPAAAIAVEVDAAVVDDAAEKATADKAIADKVAADAAQKQEAERVAAETLALAEQAKLAKQTELERAAADKQAKLDAQKLAKQQAEDERLAKVQQQKADKADAARLAKETAAKKVVVAKKEPIKKEPKRVATAIPIDPYAEPKKAPSGDASQAYKLGFQQYVRGDTSGALTTFRDSLSANPGYPPTYRGLGLVYEKMGNKPQARRAFSRYLQLSPDATDAEQIRERMERL